METCAAISSFLEGSTFQNFRRIKSNKNVIDNRGVKVGSLREKPPQIQAHTSCWHWPRLRVALIQPALFHMVLVMSQSAWISWAMMILRKLLWWPWRLEDDIPCKASNRCMQRRKPEIRTLESRTGSPICRPLLLCPQSEVPHSQDFLPIHFTRYDTWPPHVQIRFISGTIHAVLSRSCVAKGRTTGAREEELTGLMLERDLIQIGEHPLHSPSFINLEDCDFLLRNPTPGRHVEAAQLLRFFLHVRLLAPRHHQPSPTPFKTNSKSRAPTLGGHVDPASVMTIAWLRPCGARQCGHGLHHETHSISGYGFLLLSPKFSAAIRYRCLSWLKFWWLIACDMLAFVECCWWWRPTDDECDVCDPCARHMTTPHWDEFRPPSRSRYGDKKVTKKRSWGGGANSPAFAEIQEPCARETIATDSVGITNPSRNIRWLWAQPMRMVASRREVK